MECSGVSEIGGSEGYIGGQVCNAEEIIQKLRQEIAELKNQNSSLELRTYIAEKKMTEEVNLVKKKMAN